MRPKWRILGRHKWVSGATITESALENSDTGMRRFTATIRGWRNFRVWEGETAYRDMKERTDEIVKRVRDIRDRIDAGDASVFEL